MLGRITGVPGPSAANGHQHPHVHVTLAGYPQRRSAHPQITFGIKSGRGKKEGFTSMRNLSRIETMAQARGVLLEMSGGQEITAEQDEWQASIRKHNDQEFSAAFPEQETGTISLFDASRILLEHGDHDLYLG
jgi:hypothetical protein